MTREYQQCVRCVMDTEGDQLIAFSAEGICNYCRDFESMKRNLVPEENKAKQILSKVVNTMKKAGEGRPYDCLLGLSGGVDSSYLAYEAHRLGLRSLCVHFDNGWNSELAVMNIENIVNKLGFDFITYVIDWPEFRDLQRAYFKASVIDIEALTDHAIAGSIYKIAIEKDIRYILSGSNVATEGILPPHWTHKKSDYINILDIHQHFGEFKRLRSFPLQDFKQKKRVERSGIEVVDLLNLIPYSKQKAKKTLIEELDWKDYGGKHYESVFTKFYQAYILPVKFKVDKRKAHLSTLICSGQITRDQALEEMKRPLYEPSELQQDKMYVLKKLGFSEKEFDEIMLEKPVPHNHFAVEGSKFYYYSFLKPLKPIWERYKKLRKR